MLLHEKDVIQNSVCSARHLSAIFVQILDPTNLISNNLIPDTSLDTNMEAEDSAEESRHSFELRPSRGGASIRNDWTIAPEGVFCQRPDIYRKKLPEIPDHFSVKIETIDKVLSRKGLFDRHKTCSCPFVWNFGTLFWDDITIFWDENLL